MRLGISALLLFLSAVSGQSETRQFSEVCPALAARVSAYLKEHGLWMGPPAGSGEIMVGRDSAKPWTDAAGKPISDFRVYWTYAERKGASRPPLGAWRLRLSHYRPNGKLMLSSVDGQCRVEFQLRFDASGADVVIIAPFDSVWDYTSNGRMEREYLDGIVADLSQRK